MQINEVIQIVSKLNPVSIFLYGSRSRDDYLIDSDYEIGVIFDDDKYVSRNIIRNMINDSNFSIYPFKLNEVIKYELDTPFQKKIYINDLILSGKTIYGDNVIENLKTPNITVLDLIQDIRFCIGYSLSAVISDRNGDRITAKNQFYKSCLFGTRNLIILNKLIFPVGYKQILECSKDINLGQFEKLVINSYLTRIGENNYKQDDLFENIKYLNKFIEPAILDVFNTKGNINLF